MTRTIGEHPNDRITEIGQTTEKSPGDLRRPAVTQSPVENSQMSKIVIIIIIIINNNNEKHERGLITAIRNDTGDMMDNRMTITRKQKGLEKQTYRRFKRLINKISSAKTWTWLRKRNFKRETDSLLIAAQNNTVRTNCIKARIDKTQQNSKCRPSGDRDETINHMISECSKLAQKEYKTRDDWVGEVMHSEMCKKFRFDHTNKWYMHKPSSCPWKWHT